MYFEKQEEKNTQHHKQSQQVNCPSQRPFHEYTKSLKGFCNYLSTIETHLPSLIEEKDDHNNYKNDQSEENTDRGQGTVIQQPILAKKWKLWNAKILFRLLFL